MPVDYSKWDAIELSDDSDIEVHPNVDKKSFIRAKQGQIHQQRHQRKIEIETLKYERVINDGLLERINALLDALKKRQTEANTKNPDELVFQALIESAGDPSRDEPPKPPEGVYTSAKEPQPRYSKMMGSLVDQVKKEVDQKKSSERYIGYVDGVRGHLTKVQNLQQELLVKLASLEKEEKSKITSESIHDGFNTSSVSKAKPPPSSKINVGTNGKDKPKPQKVEMLNPSINTSSRDALRREDSAVSSGAEADIEDGDVLEKSRHDEDDEDEDDPDMRLTPLGEEFAKIKLGDYRALLQYISENPDVVAERETDGLLVEAFNAQMEGKEGYARTCVHHGLLLQYCRHIGRDGVAMFFNRIASKNHKASTVFLSDVNETYNRIKRRTAELSKETGKDPAGVEQIQLHVAAPGTQTHIVVPQENSTDPTEVEARKIFDRFPPGLQRALQNASLEEINKVLGKMSVDEAEEIVNLLGQGGMLSLGDGIIDATNEEGQAKLKELERENGERAVNGDKGELVETEEEDHDVA